MWQLVMAVGAADAPAGVVLGAVVVEGVVTAPLRVVHGTVVPSRKQLLCIGQRVSK